MASEVRKDTVTSGTSDPSNRFHRVIELVDKTVGEGIIPGLVLFAGKKDQALLKLSRGTKVGIETSDGGGTSLPIDAEAVFDVGSVTGLIATTTLLMKFFEAGKFAISDRMSRFVQGFGVGQKTTITIGHLLSQSSGFPPQAPFYEELTRLNSGARLGILASSGAKQYVYDHSLKIPLRSQPGEKQLFSDLNFALLGQLCELLSGLPLDRTFQRSVVQPLGLKSTSFIDLGLMKRHGYHAVAELFAGTGFCAKRDRALCGEVYDPMAWAMGGVSGHAGIFSTAEDLTKWSQEQLRVSRGESLFLKKATFETFAGAAGDVGGGAWRYGWELPNKENGLQEAGLPMTVRGIVGHGPSAVLLDPSTNSYVVFLANGTAVHHGRRIGSARSEILSALFSALG